MYGGAGGGGGSGFAPMGAPLGSNFMGAGAVPAPRPSPQMVMLLAAVKQARLYAIAAVQADIQGDYASAAANYRAAVQSLKNEVANVPPDDSQAFNDRITMYERRAEMIELIKLGTTTALPETPATEDARLPAVRPCKDCFPDPIPEDEVLRTFWLFRVFIKTLTTGGFVAPRVYVPRDVWYGQLANVRLDHQQLKCGTCFAILEYLQKLQQHTDFKDSSAIHNDLLQFCETLNALQILLAEKMACERVMKQVKKVVEGSPDDVKRYAQALTNLMKETLFLERWMGHYSSSMGASQVGGLLASVLAFYQNVFCPLVLADLRTLLAKYMHRIEAQLLSTL